MESPTLYTTASVLAAVMTMKISVFPWHIFVTKINDQIIFDKCQPDSG